MKFDIYQPHTWVPRKNNIEASLNNRAVGAIGQTLSDIRQLKEKLGRVCSKDNPDYNLAQNLDQQTSALMEVKITHSDDKVSLIMKNVDFILDFWNRTKSNPIERNYGWRTLIPYLDELKPYITSKYYSRDYLIDDLSNITVQGNAAWDLYVRTAKALEVRNQEVSKAREKIATLYELLGQDDEDDDSPPESHDCEDDDEEESS